eukprot:g43047.t1
MYSSSPPPLDDGTEIDDEFGEFGGFSGVGSSTLGYSDFDLEDHHENFMPQHHFVPGHEYSSHADGFADFHSASASDGKVFLSDFSRPAEEVLNDMTIMLNSTAVDDVGTVNEHCINSDSKTSSKLATEEFARFQEADVKDEFGDFGSMGTDSLQTFANFSESPAEKDVQTELTVYPEGDLESGEDGTTTTITKSDDDEDFGEFGSIQEANNESEFAGFKSDDFTAGEQDTEWNAFGDSVAESTSWATFGEEESHGALKEEISQCSRTEVALSNDKQLTGWADSTPVQHIGEEPQSQRCYYKVLKQMELEPGPSGPEVRTVPLQHQSPLP